MQEGAIRQRVWSVPFLTLMSIAECGREVRRGNVLKPGGGMPGGGTPGGGMPGRKPGGGTAGGA